MENAQITGIFDARKKHTVLLVINSQPDRLDPPDMSCQAARAAGVQSVIDTDTHSQSGFDFVCFGATTARRGWRTNNDVWNTLSTPSLRGIIKGT